MISDEVLGFIAMPILHPVFWFIQGITGEWQPGYDSSGNDRPAFQRCWCFLDLKVLNRCQSASPPPLMLLNGLSNSSWTLCRISVPASQYSFILSLNYWPQINVGFLALAPICIRTILRNRTYRHQSALISVFNFPITFWNMHVFLSFFESQLCAFNFFKFTQNLHAFLVEFHQIKLTLLFCWHIQCPNKLLLTEFNCLYISGTWNSPCSKSPYC